jgi:preprotein translocase subunit SecA
MQIKSSMLTQSLEGAQKKVGIYYYDIRKQLFKYDQVMNNQHKAVYTERRPVLEGRKLNAQVFGYEARTVEDIVEAYVKLELPPEEWDLSPLRGQNQGLPAGARNAYDIKEGQVEQQRPGLMRETERYFILQQIDTLWREHLQAMDTLRESVGLRGYGQKDPLIECKMRTRT